MNEWYYEHCGQMHFFIIQNNMDVFHLISNTSHIQFFFRVMFSKDSSSGSLNKWVFPANLFRSNETYDLVSTKNNFIFTMLEKGCPQKITLLLIFPSSRDTTMTRFKIIKTFSNSELQFEFAYWYYGLLQF